MSCYLVKSIKHFCNVSPKKLAALPASEIKYYDLSFVLKGSLTYRINGKKVTLFENDAILLPPGTHRSREPLSEPSKFVCFNFDINEQKSLSLPMYMPKIINTNIRKIISGFTPNHILPDGHSREEVTVILNYVLYELINSFNAESHNGYVEKAISFINTHLSEKISLNSVSEHLKLSKEYTSALFKKEMGIGITDYINKRKMLYAKEMLDSAESTSLPEIAESLGFDNYYYFSRLFKKHFGLSPMQYKKGLS